MVMIVQRWTLRPHLTSSTCPLQRLWNINGRILTALSSHGNVYHYDVSLPHSKQYPLVQKLRQEAGKDITKVTSRRSVSMATGVQRHGCSHMNYCGLFVKVLVTQSPIAVCEKRLSASWNRRLEIGVSSEIICLPG